MRGPLSGAGSGGPSLRAVSPPCPRPRSVAVLGGGDAWHWVRVRAPSLRSLALGWSGVLRFVLVCAVVSARSAMGGAGSARLCTLARLRVASLPLVGQTPLPGGRTARNGLV